MTVDEPRKILEDDLKRILAEHDSWEKSRRKKGQKANLNNADLRGANLKDVNLGGVEDKRGIIEGANLSGAILSGVDLSNAQLSGADLSNANLKNAVLKKAFLLDADLSNANLSGANLRMAGIINANFSNAYLNNADLRSAILMKSNFSGAMLYKADLRVAVLIAANFSKACVSGVNYNRKTFFNGIRADTCYGNPIFKRFAKDQDFIETLRERGGWRKTLYFIWLIFADCGRTPWLWVLWSIFFAVGFGCIYFHLGENSFKLEELQFSLSTMLYYRVVTFTTLGFGDIIPKTTQAAFWVMAEVIKGYIMLGGLISILANKLLRLS